MGVDTEKGSNHSLSVFSGHDYTILGLLGLMGACDEIQASIGFCGFALFELYRGVPPNSKLKVDAPETSEATEANVENHMGAASTSEDLYVRVKMNFQPFYDTQNNLVTVNKFHEENTVVLRDFKANDLLQLVNETKVERERKHLLDRDE